MSSSCVSVCVCCAMSLDLSEAEHKHAMLLGREQQRGREIDALLQQQAQAEQHTQGTDT